MLALPARLSAASQHLASPNHTERKAYMGRILLVTSSPRAAASYSTQVAHALVRNLVSRHPDSSLIVRDLAAEPPRHIDDSFAIARNTPPERLSAPQRVILEQSDALVSELKAADTLILAAGMINFGIPSTLKSYIDHILRPGATFRYTENGPEGLVRGKKVYFVVARGGVYSQGPMQALNFQDTYLKAALGLIGLTDIETIAIEGVAFGPDAAAKAVAAAMKRVSALTGAQPEAADDLYAAWDDGSG
jgi:FMN-dependent NADH-azoreductase